MSGTEKGVSTDPMTTEVAKLQAEIKRLFAEMEQADDRIRRYQQETDKLRIETRAILTNLKWIKAL